MRASVRARVLSARPWLRSVGLRAGDGATADCGASGGAGCAARRGGGGGGRVPRARAAAQRLAQ
eukprot:4623223-Pleurochrysis_carterae.AAC.1